MSTITTWLDSEPVRTRVYPLVILIVGYLFARGWIDHDTVNLVTSVVGLVLGAAATETARAKVRAKITPTGPKAPPESTDRQ